MHPWILFALSAASWRFTAQLCLFHETFPSLVLDLSDAAIGWSMAIPASLFLPRASEREPVSSRFRWTRSCLGANREWWSWFARGKECVGCIITSPNQV
ncbi:hypothetical protein V8C37DRAFT_370835 [Trichoderma ceciliae]